MHSKRELIKAVEDEANSLVKAVATSRYWLERWMVQNETERDENLKLAKQAYEEKLKNANTQHEQSLIKANQQYNSKVASIEADYKKELNEARNEQNRVISKAVEQYQKTILEIDNQHKRAINLAQAEYTDTEEVAKGEYGKQITAIEAEYRLAKAEIVNNYETKLNTAYASYERHTADSQETFQEAMAKAEEIYNSALTLLQQQLRSVMLSNGFSTAPFVKEAWKGYQPPNQGHLMPAVTRLGILTETGPWGPLVMPACIPIIGGQSLILKTTSGGKERAISAIQAIMLRLLATVSPGKLCFTFIDPIGRGQNVAAFMHLKDIKDVGEALVTSRAWTEQSHIEQRLTDLTEHIENIIQNNLRNKFGIVSISWGRKLPQSLVQFKALLFNKIGLDLHFELNRSKLERN